jgi:DNA-binding NtrC family response regulator
MPVDERETEVRTRPHEIASVPALKLVVVGGGAAADSSRQVTQVIVSSRAPMRMHVGTSSLSDLQLSDPAVSRRHFAIEPSPTSQKAFRIIDLASTNGTLLNDVPVVEAYVRPGDTLKVGATTIRVLAAEVDNDEPIVSAMQFGRVVGASDAMRRLYLLCERLAAASVPTLIEGERGTGKETLAESLHSESRRPGSFLVFDCGAGETSALAAELFGDARGPGLYERAKQGTLLLDEVGELPLELQQKLARVIDRRELRRVGGEGSEARDVADVRVIATTRTDLDRLVNAGRFDEHLLGSLSVTRVTLPPLRHRHGDVKLLARHFAEELGASSATADAVLASSEGYAWPGNVSELKGAVLRHAALGELSAFVQQGTTKEEEATEGAKGDGADDWLARLIEKDQPFSVVRRLAIEEFERRYVAHVLAANNGSVSRAAAASGLALRHFQRVKSRHVSK